MYKFNDYSGLMTKEIRSARRDAKSKSGRKAIKSLRRQRRLINATEKGRSYEV